MSLAVEPGSDLFVSETFSTTVGETWCDTNDNVPSELSRDNFKLTKERSVYVYKSGTKDYTLTPVVVSEMKTTLLVKRIYCRPTPPPVPSDAKAADKENIADVFKGLSDMYDG
jgi:hypothetical protein